MESDQPNSLEDIFDLSLNLEETHFDEGFNEGFSDGLASGIEEGRQVGLKHGFETGKELGFYRGCIDGPEKHQDDGRFDPEVSDSQPRKRVRERDYGHFEVEV
ncbi:hypothetical protein U1Q18_001473 [Sarracenia purpurea var. burkii]